MLPATRTPEGEPNHCPICGKSLVLEPSSAGDAPCPHCGSLVWFPEAGGMSRNPGFPAYQILADWVLTTEQAFRAVVARLVADRQMAAADTEQLIQGLLKREQLGSTGFGGFAIPHTLNHQKHLVGALARFPGGVDFDSIDGKPVHTVFLLVSPPGCPGDYLRVLERAALHFRQQCNKS